MDWTSACLARRCLFGSDICPKACCFARRSQGHTSLIPKTRSRYRPIRRPAGTMLLLPSRSAVLPITGTGSRAKRSRILTAGRSRAWKSQERTFISRRKMARLGRQGGSSSQRELCRSLGVRCSSKGSRTAWLRTQASTMISRRSQARRSSWLAGDRAHSNRPRCCTRWAPKWKCWFVLACPLALAQTLGAHLSAGRPLAVRTAGRRSSRHQSACGQATLVPQIASPDSGSSRQARRAACRRGLVEAALQ